MKEVWIIIKKLTGLSPFLVATITAALYLAAFTSIKYAISKESDWATAITGTAAIWVVYFFLQHFINRMIRKRMQAAAGPEQPGKSQP